MELKTPFVILCTVIFHKGLLYRKKVQPIRLIKKEDKKFAHRKYCNFLHSEKNIDQ